MDAKSFVEFGSAQKYLVAHYYIAASHGRCKQVFLVAHTSTTRPRFCTPGLIDFARDSSKTIIILQWRYMVTTSIK